MTDGQAQIRFRKDGEVREWGVGCDADVDNEATMEAHLHKWIGGAEFLGVCITRVKEKTVAIDTRRDSNDDRTKLDAGQRPAEDREGGVRLPGSGPLDDFTRA